MNRNSNKFTNLKCSLHEQTIEFIDPDPSKDKILYCSQCLADIDSKIKFSLEPFESFSTNLEAIFKEHLPLKFSRSFPETLLFKSEEILIDFSQLIEAKKVIVKEQTQRLINVVLEIIKNHEKSLLSNLDVEIAKLKSKLEEFNNKVSFYYNSTAQTEEKPLTYENIKKTISECQDLNNLEKSIKQLILKGDELEDSRYVLRDELSLLSRLREIKSSIIEEAQNGPNSTALHEHKIKAQISKNLAHLDMALGGIYSLSNPLKSLDESANRSIILSEKELNILSEKLNLKSSLKLVFRGRKRNFDFEELEKLLAPNEIVTLIKTTDQQVFGCYKIKSASSSPELKSNSKVVSKSFNLTELVFVDDYRCSAIQKEYIPISSYIQLIPQTNSAITDKMKSGIEKIIGFCYCDLGKAKNFFQSKTSNKAETIYSIEAFEIFEVSEVKGLHLSQSFYF